MNKPKKSKFEIALILLNQLKQLKPNKSNKSNKQSTIKESFIVGECVLKHILNIANNNKIDIITTIPLSELEKNFDFKNNKIWFYNEYFNIKCIKYTKNYLQSHSKLKDTTINTLYMDSDNIIHDFCNAQQDIQNKIIKTTINADDEFKRRPVTILNILKYASIYNFKIDTKTFESIVSNIYLLKSINVQEFTSVLFEVTSYKSKALIRFINLIIKSNIVNLYIPELNNLMYYEQSLEFHPEGAMVYDKKTDTYTKYNKNKHSTQSTQFVIDNGTVLDHTLAAINEYKGNNIIVLLSLLFHDIGKPDCAQHKDDYYVFPGHEIVSNTLFIKIFERLSFTNINYLNAISFCIKNHKFNPDNFSIKNMLKLRKSKHWVALKAVITSDRLCRHLPGDSVKLKEAFKTIDEAHTKYDKQYIINNKIKKIINGNIIKTEFNGVQSRDIGVLLSVSKRYIIDNDFNVTTVDVINYIKEKHYEAE